MQTSNDGIKFITDQEGFSAKAYKDGFINNVQKFSIGYGHQILPNERELLTATITREKGRELFRKNLIGVENAINQNAKRVLNQHQFDALASFGYNAGTGALYKVLQTWNATGSEVDTVAHLKEYRGQNTPSGFKVLPELVSRRAKEAAIFLKKKDGLN